MKNKVAFFFVIVSFQCFSQMTKAKLADSIPGWFRYEKGRHALNFHTGVNAVGFTNSNGEKVRIFAPGLYLGYSYATMNRLVLNTNVCYAHHFNEPIYDSRTIYYNLGLDYILLGKNRVFFAPGVNFMGYNYRYRIHPDYPDHRFYDDTIVNIVNSRTVYFLQPKIEFGIYIGNNMSVRIGVMKNIFLNKPSGRQVVGPIMFNLNATYHFPMKKYQSKR